jgi:hypothetical protein
MQRGRRDHGIDLGLRQGIAPPWVAQIRAHHLHAAIVPRGVV